jgi:hypothetical protein
MVTGGKPRKSSVCNYFESSALNHSATCPKCHPMNALDKKGVASL